MYCYNCGSQVPESARFCPDCGADLQDESSAVRTKQPRGAGNAANTAEGLVYPRDPPLSPHLAWLTLLLTGLPHWLYGQTAKGFIWLVVALAAMFLLPIIGWLVVDAIAIIDAYQVGNKLASGQPVRKMEWFPG